MWNKLIEGLLESGLKEQEIADRLTAKGVHATQPTINRIKTGEIGNPRYELGAALVTLHNEICKPKRRSQQEARA